MSPSTPRIAVLGSGIREIDSLFESVLQSFETSEVKRAQIAGCSIRQAKVRWPDQRGGFCRLTFSLATCEADFADFYRAYFASASGVVALLPTGPEQVTSARQILDLARAGSHREGEDQQPLPLILQYQWQAQHLGQLSLANVDRALGLAIDSERILSRLDDLDQLQGASLLVEHLTDSIT